MDNKIKNYHGRVPACGIFCGGCPTYTRDKKPCPGAELNKARCEQCKSYHLCCQEKGISHCHQCPTFPCRRLKEFSKRWLKYGQNMLENQQLLKDVGDARFITYFNQKVKDSENE